MPNDRWLVISYYANAPEKSFQEAASRHVMARLPFLRDHGIDPTLLTSRQTVKSSEYRHRRAAHLAPSGLHAAIRRFVKARTTSKFAREAFSLLLFLPFFPFYLLEKLMIRAEQQWSWMPSACFLGLTETIRGRYTAIYSSDWCLHSHLVGVFLSKVTGLPHIVEFHDPLPFIHVEKNKYEGKHVLDLEKKIVAKAKWSVFLTKTAAANGIDRTGMPEKIRHIYAGANPQPSIAEYKRGADCSLVHVGMLYDARRLSPLVSALELCGFSGSTPLMVRLYGHVKEEIWQEAASSVVSRLFVKEGVVARDEAERLMQVSDVLLLIQHSSDISKETIPSKTYEYMQSGRPILALVWGNVELRELLESEGHWAVEIQDPAALSAALSECLDAWKTGRLEKKHGACPYTIENAVDQLVGLLKAEDV